MDVDEPFDPGVSRSTGEIDHVFTSLVDRQPVVGSLLACLYTSSGLPPFCSPMRRDPRPEVGMVLDGQLARHVLQALSDNPAVHDGALMIGRTSVEAPYRVTGWSFRLHPPDVGLVSVKNRGSAFNSCLAMSAVKGIDLMYLISGGELHRFAAGVMAASPRVSRSP